MKGLRDKLILTLVLLEVLLLVLPSSLMYLLVMTILVVGSFTGHVGVFGFNAAFFLLTLVLLIPGYALFSLWWLIFKYRGINGFRLVPGYIYGGVLLGILSTLFLAAPFSFSTSLEFISLAEQMKNKLYFGLGPFIVLVTLTAIIYFQRDSNDNALKNKSPL